MQMILSLTLLTGFTSKRVSLITAWLIMVGFFANFLPFEIHRNELCVVLHPLSVKKESLKVYKVLLPYPVRILLIYTSVMGLNFKIINLISSLMASRVVFIKSLLCYFECICFIFISLF